MLMPVTPPEASKRSTSHLKANSLGTAFLLVILKWSWNLRKIVVAVFPAELFTIQIDSSLVKGQSERCDRFDGDLTIVVKKS